MPSDDHVMLEIPAEFFVAEERNDFFVSATMKSYWACCMEIVNIIDKVCKKYDIRYFAHAGTLLGAARHGGFIPWDDDIDLALLRPDFEKLMQVLPGELPEGYKLSTPSTNNEHRQFFSGVSNGVVMDVSKEHVAKFYNCPFVATIDIFQLDYIPSDKNETEALRSLFITIWSAIQKIAKEHPAQEIEAAVQQVEQCLDVKIVRNEYMRSQLWELANQLVKSYTYDEADYLVEWCAYVNKNNPIKKEYYDETVWLPFESMQIPVPANYKEVLTVLYGDWETPIRGTQCHDYPCFKRQLEFLRRKVKELQEEEAKKA